jgi:hypothetical protein
MDFIILGKQRVHRLGLADELGCDLDQPIILHLREVGAQQFPTDVHLAVCQAHLQSGVGGQQFPHAECLEHKGAIEPCAKVDYPAFLERLLLHQIY